MLCYQVGSGMANIEKTRQIKRDWARKYRKEQREVRLIIRHRCPTCEILLYKEFEVFHRGCSWYEFNKGSIAHITGYGI